MIKDFLGSTISRSLVHSKLKRHRSVLIQFHLLNDSRVQMRSVCSNTLKPFLSVDFVHIEYSDFLKQTRGDKTQKDVADWAFNKMGWIKKDGK